MSICSYADYDENTGHVWGIYEASMVIQEAENQFRIYYKEMDKNGIEYYDN